MKATLLIPKTSKIVLLFLLTTFSIAHAQTTKRPIVNTDFTVEDSRFGNMKLVGTHCECNGLDVNGKPTADITARRFYYFPFLALQKGTDENIIINEPTSGVVIIPLVLDIPFTREIFQRELLDKKLISEGTSAGNIQMASLNQLFVRTDKSYRHNIIFNPIPVPADKSITEISVRINDPATRKEFIDEFKKGLVSLEATLFFDGFGTLNNIAVLTFDQLRATDTYQKITGDGGEGNVTRNKIGKLAQEAVQSNNIFVRTEFDDPDFKALVEGLLSKLNASELAIKKDLSDVQAQFEAAGIDSKDFAADVINSSKLIVNQENQRKFVEEVNKHRTGSGSAEGKADVLGIINVGGQASGSFTKDDARKVMEEVFKKYSIESSFDGTKVIPKSIDIYRFEEAKWRSAGTFTVGNAKIIKKEGSISKIISPNTDFFKVGSNSPIPISSQFVPIGTILPFAGEKIPEGYLLCDGKEYDRVLHKPLFDVIGTLWGQILPTHFRVPDLRGQFLRGLDVTGEFDPDRPNEKRKVGTSQGDATKMPNNKFTTTTDGSDHNHNVATDITDAPNFPHQNVAAKKGLNRQQTFATDLGGKHVHTIIGGDNETRPKNVVVNYIIKAK